MQAALRRCSLIVLGVGAFSGVINLLALTGSFYMLQVYDRVLTSRSVPTLVGLTRADGGALRGQRRCSTSCACA